MTPFPAWPGAFDARGYAVASLVQAFDAQGYAVSPLRPEHSEAASVNARKRFAFSPARRSSTPARRSDSQPRGCPRGATCILPRLGQKGVGGAWEAASVHARKRFAFSPAKKQEADSSLVPQNRQRAAHSSHKLGRARHARLPNPPIGYTKKMARRTPRPEGVLQTSQPRLGHPARKEGRARQ